jgi:hypothetical protein
VPILPGPGFVRGFSLTPTIWPRAANVLFSGPYGVASSPTCLQDTSCCCRRKAGRGLIALARRGTGRRAATAKDHVPPPKCFPSEKPTAHLIHTSSRNCRQLPQSRPERCCRRGHARITVQTEPPVPLAKCERSGQAGTSATHNCRPWPLSRHSSRRRPRSLTHWEPGRAFFSKGRQNQAGGALKKVSQASRPPTEAPNAAERRVVPSNVGSVSTRMAQSAQFFHVRVCDVGGRAWQEQFRIAHLKYVIVIAYLTHPK